MTKRKEFADLIGKQSFAQEQSTVVTKETIVELPEVTDVTVRLPDDTMVPLSVVNEMIAEIRASLTAEIKASIASSIADLTMAEQSIQPDALKSIEDRLLALESVKQSVVRPQPTSWKVERDDAGNLVRFAPE